MKKAAYRIGWFFFSVGTCIAVVALAVLILLPAILADWAVGARR